MSDYEELMKTEKRWVEAHQTLNTLDIEDILDDGYKRIEGTAILGKAETLASYQSGQRHWDVAEGSDYTVNIHNEFATVVGLWRGVGVNHGEHFDYSARFLSVYIKRSNGWKLYRDESFESK